MKIFVVGATGRVASELVKELVAKGHQVTAAARHPENVLLKDSPQVTAVKLDLHASKEELAALIGQQDAIYFTAGSRGKDLLQTDAFGAVKTMQAAELNGIMDYNIAKFFADHYLVHNTDLDYTILQPTALTEEPGTGKITVGATKVSKNPIPDVALTLAEILEHDNTREKVIMMSSGDTLIEQALASV